ncbi:hypothetical protein BC831DRAFT_438497 [Entophlyctis helioformis]|nr:hypothetical protein BC831DRAFT_438497 [Entophlyctis helioformis]
MRHLRPLTPIAVAADANGTNTAASPAYSTAESDASEQLHLHQYQQYHAAHQHQQSNGALPSPFNPAHSPISAPQQPHRRRLSGTFFDYVTTLERTNIDLRHQLDTALANLRDADMAHARNLKSLREANEGLQTQLRDTMTEMRDESTSHAQVVTALEADMEYLRNELSRVAQTAQELEAEKRRLLREKMETLKESRVMGHSDQELISELHARIATLETDHDRLTATKADLEKRAGVLRHELNACHERIAELTARAEDATAACRAFEAKARGADEMREQLEDLQARVMALDDEATFSGIGRSGGAMAAGAGAGSADRVPPGSTRVIMTKEGWEWTPWLERARVKAWERDMAGLREEINDLRSHQQQAYNRLKNELSGMAGRMLSFIPNPLQPLSSLTSSVLGTGRTAPAVTESAAEPSS